MADALHDLGFPVSDRVLVLNVVRGLSSTYDHMKTWNTRQRPFPSFLQVRDDLALEVTRGLAPGSPSSTSTALVAAPPASSASPATSLLGAPPPGPSGGGRGDVVVALLLVGVVGARRHRLRLLLLPLEVRPSHPSATHGQSASRCGRFRVRGASSSAPAGGHVHQCYSLVRAVLNSTRSAQPVCNLVWG